MIKCKAAVAWGPNQPLSIEEIDVMPPQVGTGLGNAARITHLAWPPLKIKDGEFQNFSFQEQVAQQGQKIRRGVTR